MEHMKAMIVIGKVSENLKDDPENQNKSFSGAYPVAIPRLTISFRSSKEACPGRVSVGAQHLSSIS
jgi:hypothetical protein